MIRSARIATAALSSALVLGVLSPAPASAAADFYTPPTNLPAANGALVRTEPMKLAIPVPQGSGSTTLPGSATRIMYKTTDEGGDPAAVSGVYIEPSKPWTGKGARPLISFSVGTQGVGDACAPSKTLESFLVTESGKFMVGYEIPAIYNLLNDGVAMVITDYIGLGTTDRVHTYMNREDQAHAVLDAARAALRLPNTSITSASPIGLYGYSQGGGAAAAAAESAPTYAPELNLKAAYIGGPPANLFEVMKSADNTLLTGVIAWAINAITPYRPELAPHLGNLLNAKGLAYLEKSKDQCIADAILGAGGKKTSEWTNSGNVASVEVKKYPEIMKAVEDQRIGKLTPRIPVQIATGTKDDIVDHGQAKQLALDWCAKGVNVTYKPVIQLASSGGLMLTHLGPMITQLGSSKSWILDRFNGKSASSNCSTARYLP
ncbi:lipase family protein [Nocardioides sp. 616]|uniref:lipase family protein n=1 Tax=Nocardioides sp. 616 TaxID=2268090 RepID=UPI000CE57733|nr:lipase family protein [Nocardioides sp. 616]